MARKFGKELNIGCLPSQLPNQNLPYFLSTYVYILEILFQTANLKSNMQLPFGIQQPS